MSPPPTTTKSPFLCLPAELRVMVYGFVFASGQTTTISDAHEIPPTQYPTLLLTCKGIRREAYQEHFKYTSFTSDFSTATCPWLDRLPKAYVAKIGRLCVHRVSHRSRVMRNMCSNHRLALQRVKDMLVEARRTRRFSRGSAPGPLSAPKSTPATPCSPQVQSCSDMECPFNWRERLIGEIQKFAERYQARGLKQEAVLVALPLNPLGTLTAWVGVEDLSSRRWQKNEVQGVTWFYASRGSV